MKKSFFISKNLVMFAALKLLQCENIKNIAELFIAVTHTLALYMVTLVRGFCFFYIRFSVRGFSCRVKNTFYSQNPEMRKKSIGLIPALTNTCQQVTAFRGYPVQTNSRTWAGRLSILFKVTCVDLVTLKSCN